MGADCGRPAARKQEDASQHLRLPAPGRDSDTSCVADMLAAGMIVDKGAARSRSTPILMRHGASGCRREALSSRHNPHKSLVADPLEMCRGMPEYSQSCPVCHVRRQVSSVRKRWILSTGSRPALEASGSTPGEVISSSPEVCGL